jgi:hypothetical protein
MDLLSFLMEAMELFGVLMGLFGFLLLLVLVAALLLATIVTGGRLLWRGSQQVLRRHVAHNESHL